MRQQIIKKDGKPDTDKDTYWSWLITYIEPFRDGTRFEWELKVKKKTRKDPQRINYFANIMPKFMEAVGHHPPEVLAVHRHLKITWFENQPYVLEKYGLKPIIKDERGYHHNVPRLFSKKSKIPFDVRAQFVRWVTQIAAEYGAEF